MGNSASGDDYYEDDIDKFDGIDTLGYRVLGVQPNSPASSAGLVSFFDFLVGANGKMLLGSSEGLEVGDEYDDVDFPSLLQEFTGKPLELLVWNIKSQEKRLVTIVPSSDWGGAGLLGVTIRMDNYGGADERLIRVLETERNSPAAIAGLVPEQDYLLGTARHSLQDTSDLANILQDHVDRVVELYVYNTTSDVVRIVTLMPTWSWGGKGLLGAEVGTGYLHRLPNSCRGTNGSSMERKVVTRKRQQQQQGKEQDSDAKEHVEEENQLCMAPQLEMEPEPGQAHAMPMPDLHPPPEPPKNQREDEPRPIQAPEAPVPETVPETVPEPEIPVPPPPPAIPVTDTKATPAVSAPPPPPADVIFAKPPPAVSAPPPPPEPSDRPASSSVAMAYAAPSSTTARAAAASAAASNIAKGPTPPPPPPPPAPFASTSYASAFLPPPPMSHLSKENNDEEVDLR